MMLNKLPTNTSLSNILSFIETKTKFGIRNRALFLMRQNLRLRDISEMLVSDVLNPDLTIRRFYTAKDGTKYELSEQVRTELDRYLIVQFTDKSKALESISLEDFNLSLFPTQKAEKFTPNTIAQHFSLQDRLIHEHFKQSTSTAEMNKNTEATPPTHRNRNRLFRSFSALS
jgi:flagellar biosynthesis component FlhA